jgi:sodium-dependent phosphate cotransporter
VDGLSDAAAGGILFVLSLTMLSSCLVLLVKVLQSLLKGKNYLENIIWPMILSIVFSLTGAVADMVRQTLNADLPRCPWLTGYLAILAGALFTFLVQSSSVFTSTLTPLVGVGLVTVERVYPLTLGSNLGTTTTALLAAMSADPDMIRATVQIALCHLFFNLTGIN